jgi:hypothetical protein
MAMLYQSFGMYIYSLRHPLQHHSIPHHYHSSHILYIVHIFCTLIMGFLGHSLAAILVLAGVTPLVSGRSLPNTNTLVPRGSSPGFNCVFPPNWKTCNDENNRDCWVIDPNGKRYDIKTDYEKDIPPGIERPYSITVDESPFSPDGTVKPLAKLIDGKFPGTLIEACWGDT